VRRRHRNNIKKLKRIRTDKRNIVDRMAQEAEEAEASVNIMFVMT